MIRETNLGVLSFRNASYKNLNITIIIVYLITQFWWYTGDFPLRSGYNKQPKITRVLSVFSKSLGPFLIRFSLSKYYWWLLLLFIKHLLAGEGNLTFPINEGRNVSSGNPVSLTHSKNSFATWLFKVKFAKAWDRTTYDDPL